MARTVVAIYDDFETANDAVRDLVDSGLPRDNISIIAANNRGDYRDTRVSGGTTTGENVADETGAGAGVGAGIGAAVGGIGGLLVGLGALVIPGIGPVIAAGPLAVALSTLTGAGVGAVAGGVTGGLLGALIGLGIPEEEAQYYAEGVRRGGVLVTVQADDFNTDQIMDVLNRHSPVDLQDRVAQWRERGWKGYDPNMPATAEERMESSQSASSKYGIEFNADNPVYREHFDSYLTDSGYPYDYYIPAYQYGYGLSSNPRYQDSTWNLIENDVRMDWERDHPNTWDRMKAAIRYAWEDVTGQPHSYNM